MDRLRGRPSDAEGVIAKMRRDAEFANNEVTAAQQFHRGALEAGGNGVAVYGRSQARSDSVI